MDLLLYVVSLVAIIALTYVARDLQNRVKALETQGHWHPDAEPAENLETPTMAIDSLEYEQLSIAPKPEWETKKTWFTISKDELLNTEVRDWDVFVRKLAQVWINMLQNDGYEIRGVVSSYIEASVGVFQDMKKVTLEVQVYKEPDDG